MSTKKQDAAQAQPPPDNVDQIREILFGGHIRAFDERFEAVEKRLSKESDALRKTLENRVLELEKLLGQFREDAGDQLSKESTERDSSLGKVNESIAAFRLDTENQLAELQSEFNAEIKQVRQELDTAQKSLVDELASLQAAQTKRSDHLDDDKVSRGELAAFLSDVADRLTPAANKRSK